jgi:pectinesterase
MKNELPQICHTYVAPDGSADYQTVQEAVDAVPHHNDRPVVIHLAPGVYKEKLTIPGDKPHIKLEGKDAESTILTYDDFGGKVVENGDIASTFRSGSVNIFANDTQAQQITFENTSNSPVGHQALALYASGEHLFFKECRFLGRQDTLYVKDGTQLYQDCYIQGDIDFIFGGARAVFENCRIFAKNNRSQEELDKGKGGYISAPSTPLAQKYGLLFVGCSLDSDYPENRIYLGRPWHPGADPYAVGCAVFRECQLGEAIKEEGWSDMGGYLAANARLYEYKNYGAGAKSHERRRQLTEEEAAVYTKERVLGIY